MNETTATTFVMRRGDRLPLLALVVEDDDGRPVDLTGQRAWIMFRPVDGEPALVDGLTGWYIVEAMVPAPTSGVVAYDWEESEVDALTIGVFELAVCIGSDPLGELVTMLTAPTARDAKLIVRPGVTA